MSQPMPWPPQHRTLLPAWIEQLDSYQALRANYRRTMEAIAEQCNDQHADGSLVGAIGGQRLAHSAGCSISTLFRHISRLEQLGVVVCIGRGGVLAGRNYGNIYGIPGAPGALDTRRASRRMQRMVQGGDGKWRAEIIEPGDQVMLWPKVQAEAPTFTPSPAPGSSKVDTGVPPDPEKLTRGVVSIDSTPVSVDTPPPCQLTRTMDGMDGKYHGRLRSGSDPGPSPRPPARKGRLGHVDRHDLEDNERLTALHQRAVAAGVIGANEADRVRFWGAAERALRVAADPPALFASIVRGQRWLLISEEDERRALARLKPARPRPSAPNVKTSTTSLHFAARPDPNAAAWAALTDEQRQQAHQDVLAAMPEGLRAKIATAAIDSPVIRGLILRHIKQQGGRH